MFFLLEKVRERQRLIIIHIFILNRFFTLENDKSSFIWGYYYDNSPCSFLRSPNAAYLRKSFVSHLIRQSYIITITEICLQKLINEG